MIDPHIWPTTGPTRCLAIPIGDDTIKTVREMQLFHVFPVYPSDPKCLRTNGTSDGQKRDLEKTKDSHHQFSTPGGYGWWNPGPLEMFRKSGGSDRIQNNPKDPLVCLILSDLEALLDN